MPSAYLTPAMSEISNNMSHTNAIDYTMARNEIEQQRKELLDQRKRENSFWHRVGRGAIGAIPGLIAGIPGGPAGMAAGAGAGFAAGALAPQGTNAAALGVLAAGAGGKMGGGWTSTPTEGSMTPSGTGGGLEVPLETPNYAPAGNTFDEVGPYSESSLTPEQKYRMMLGK